MQDEEAVFRELNLQDGNCFLDLGCGPGEYSMRAAACVGNAGRVYAVDKWGRAIEELSSRAREEGLTSIQTINADITGPLPIPDRDVDVCLMATVLHIIRLSDQRKTLFEEIRRVLKPAGRLAVIECKKEEWNFGPPVHIRLAPEEIESFVEEFGFIRQSYGDLGYNYIIQFVVMKKD